MLYILYGPPGIGKSTIISAIKSLIKEYPMIKFARAIDLENYSIPWRRKEVFHRLQKENRAHPERPVWVGAADLSPKVPVDEDITRKVLLWADPRIYTVRRKDRDEAIPGKASQRKHNMEDWLQFVDRRHGWTTLRVMSDPETEAEILLEDFLYFRSER